MINGNLETFLDYGWFTEATLFYKGYTYWFEGYYSSKTNKHMFFVNRWKSKLTKDMCTYRYIVNDDILGYSEVYRIEGTDQETLQKQFLEAPIFDGKSFWQVEKELIQVDDSGCITINSEDEF